MRRLFWAVGCLLIPYILAVGFLPGVIGRRMNRVSAGQPPPSARAQTLHAKLLVADFHADTLLWSRDVLKRGGWGHVDVPRLLEGNVAVQAFTVVTKTPRGQNIERNDDSSDNIFWLALVERWPTRSLFSLKERALYQARRLAEAASASGGSLTLVRTGSDLERFLNGRQGRGKGVAGFLGIEGAQALDDEVQNLPALFDAGFRMIAPTHFSDNAFGGSAHGVRKGGLTEKGRILVRLMEEMGLIVDLAHASHQTIADTLSIARRPVVVSHTGVRGTCDNSRNLTDDELRAIAAKGGVIGIGFFQTAVCGDDVAAIIRAITHATKVAGIDHVGLGSDFDGAVTTPFDASGLALVTDGLLAAGFTEEDLGKIMGKNEIRLLEELLPR